MEQCSRQRALPKRCAFHTDSIARALADANVRGYMQMIMGVLMHGRAALADYVPNLEPDALAATRRTLRERGILKGSTSAGK